MRIITIIPAYNEEHTIAKVVDGVKKFSDALVVDDGSMDQTSLLAKKEGSEVIKHKQPTYFILENVKGLLYHEKGNTWSVVIDEIEKLKDLGYYID